MLQCGSRLFRSTDTSVVTLLVKKMHYIFKRRDLTFFFLFFFFFFDSCKKRIFAFHGVHTLQLHSLSPCSFFLAFSYERISNPL